MLVFTRKQGERIAIGGEIELTVVEIGPDCVKLQLHAPESVPIRRQHALGRIIGETVTAIDRCGATAADRRVETAEDRRVAGKSPYFPECA